MMKNMMSIDSMNLKKDEEILEQLIARGSLYKLFSLGFNYPNKELISLLSSPNYQKLIIESPKVLKSKKLSKAIKDFIEYSSKLNIIELEKDFNRIFVAKPMLTLFGEEYGAHVFSKVNQMADIVGFYKAFGIKQPTGERVDNICLELEFMFFLISKEIYAFEKGWKEKAEICRIGESKFVGDHILGWYAIFSEKFGILTEQDFYRKLTVCLKEFIASEKTYLNAKETPLKIISHSQEISKQIDLLSEKAGCGDESFDVLNDDEITKQTS